ncbi:MAG: MmgE/PrpD family protein [Vicinamibacterales bacterium]
MPQQTRATSAVIDFITTMRLADVPAEAITIGKRCIIDGLGVMLAGSTAPASRILRDQVLAGGTRAEATAIGPEPVRVSAANAALLNGLSGHAHDFDDTQLSTTADRIFGLLTHPTIPPLAAALAVGERQKASGAQVLEAFMAGFEVECKIAESIHPNHYKKGFHSSGTVGTFGAMTATARLLGLNREQLGHALAIAASLASGIRVNFGTMTKPLHVGRAAQNGVTAAELASRGFTGGGDALDGPWGFFQVLSHGDGFDPDRIVPVLGNPHTIVKPGVSIKPYPCGVLGHPSMDAMRTLVVTHDVKPEQIKAIRLRAGSNILNPLRYGVAQSELEAKFSPPFMLAAIALNRKAGIREFSDEFVRSAPVQAMMAKVTPVLDQEIEAKGFEKIRSTVEVDLLDGRTLVQAADERYRGGPDRPFTREDLQEKFTDCASEVLPASAMSPVIDAVNSLESLDDIAGLIRLLSPAPAAR